MKDKIFLLDSNVLIYYFDKSDIKKHSIAKNMIDKCWDSLETLVVSSQNLSEFFSVTTNKRFLSKKEAGYVVYNILEFRGWMKINFTHKTILEACKLSEEYNMPYWDSLLAATMRENGIFYIYTENIKDFKMPWINAVNPFSS